MTNPMRQCIIHSLLIFSLMLSGMGESLHALNFFDHHPQDTCGVVSEHFDSPDQSVDNDCVLCQLNTASRLLESGYCFEVYETVINDLNPEIVPVASFTFFGSWLTRAPPVS